MGRMSRLELLSEMGFTSDPFKQMRMRSNDFSRINRFINLTIKGRGMVSVVGERGIGKSNAVRAALHSIKEVRSVHIHANDINKLLISDIEQALILDLSNEKPKRGREIRARQLRRIVGEATRRTEVVVIIEEGHHLHGMTLRSIKRLREMEWMGESELFSIVLVCQSNPMCKQGVAEVRIRADAIHMEGLLREEINNFITGTVGKAFDNEAIEAIADLPDSHNYEDLKSILVGLMETALFAGRKQVLIDDVETMYHTGNLEEMRTRVGVSKAHLARETGLSQPTVSKLLKNEKGGNIRHSEKEKLGILRDALKRHHNESIEGKQAVVAG